MLPNASGRFIGTELGEVQSVRRLRPHSVWRFEGRDDILQKDGASSFFLAANFTSTSREDSNGKLDSRVLLTHTRVKANIQLVRPVAGRTGRHVRDLIYYTAHIPALSHREFVIRTRVPAIGQGLPQAQKRASFSASTSRQSCLHTATTGTSTYLRSTHISPILSLGILPVRPETIRGSLRSRPTFTVSICKWRE
jgi:hypothetical protein